MIDEKSLLLEVKKYLNKARPGDFEHTLNVVTLIKKFLKIEKGNPGVLIPSAYLHDIGYSGLLKKGKQLGKMGSLSMLDEHMKRGKNISIKILSELKYPRDMIERISWMVSVHDDWYNQNDHELGILIDADNLAKLNVIDIKRKYKNPKDIIGLWERDMPKRLKTKTGKKLYFELMNNVKKEFAAR